jgi:ABC-type multidrug transport system ATPase subunit
MEASTMARQQKLKDNDKAKEQIAELQEFVRRFSANASKARQATSRAKQIDKIKVEEFVPSSRQYPYIRFDYDDKDKLHRQAVEIKNLTHGFDRELFKNFNLLVEAGERIAVIGENGIGKTTFLRCLVNDLNPNHGDIKWAEKAKIGYFSQDHATDFEKDLTLFDWMKDCAQSGEDDQAIRSILGRLLFSGEDTKKSVKVLSGGEQGRMLFGKLMLAKTNVLLMDEPTNHVLQNGIRVCTERMRQSSVAAVGVFIGSGSRNETLESSGAAHFLEHLHFKGTTNRTRRQLESEVENAGAQLNAYTSREHTLYHMLTFPDGLNKSVEVLGDMLCNSTYDH